MCQSRLCAVVLDQRCRESALDRARLRTESRGRHKCDARSRGRSSRDSDAQRGQGMAADIAEQPAGYARLLDGRARRRPSPQVAARVAERRPRHVVFVARGTSDHAALYGAYLTEIRLGLPGRARLAERDHRLRRPPRPLRRAGRRRQPERRLARPDRGAARRPRVRRAHPRGHQQPRLAAGAGRRAVHRRRRRARAGGRRDEDVHRRAARAAAAGRGRPGRRRRAAGRRAGRAGRAAGAGRATARRHRRRPTSPSATGSPASWSPPAGGTRTRPPARPR